MAKTKNQKSNCIMCRLWISSRLPRRWWMRGVSG